MSSRAKQAEITDLHITLEGDIPPQQEDAVRRHVERIAQYASEPLIGVRLTLRHAMGLPKRPYVADASLLFEGRLLAAHATGPDPVEATDAAIERLRRQLRRVVGADVAQRNEPAMIRRALEDLEHDRRHRPEARLKPPEERQIVHRRTYADHPESTLEAIADMLDLDEEFHLFVHARTGEDVVVHRRDDGKIGLIHPRGSALADEGDVIVPEPSRYSEPLTLDKARAEMDIVNHRFLYFIDADDGRGKVLYLRHDGDYGLVEPE
jgi:ribosome-associated translation inhibitor RaiA